eukprot:8334549-Prorocentrum_lima.AAC.1
MATHPSRRRVQCWHGKAITLLFCSATAPISLTYTLYLLLLLLLPVLQGYSGIGLSLPSAAPLIDTALSLKA